MEGNLGWFSWAVLVWAGPTRGSVVSGWASWDGLTLQQASLGLLHVAAGGGPEGVRGRCNATCILGSAWSLAWQPPGQSGLQVPSRFKEWANGQTAQQTRSRWRGKLGSCL